LLQNLTPHKEIAKLKIRIRIIILALFNVQDLKYFHRAHKGFYKEILVTITKIEIEAYMIRL
jgi:hypothetical protein